MVYERGQDLIEKFNYQGVFGLPAVDEYSSKFLIKWNQDAL
jgi:hypothetical protein